MKTAVFDLDRTLLPTTTAERIFLRRLVRERVIGTRALLETGRFLVRERGSGAVKRVKADRPYLIGQHDATLRLHGYRCVREELIPALSERGIDFLFWHRQQNHQIVLLSGSLPYVVEPLAAALNIQHVVCSQVETRKQRLTGRLEGLHPYGDAKAKLMLEFGQTHGVDFDVSYCYADHHSDEPLLRLFGNPVCVNPSSRLREIAREHGWRIEVFG